MMKFEASNLIHHEYFKVMYAYGCSDVATCKTLEDARIRQEEIRQNQSKHGYEPDESHIYQITVNVVQSNNGFIISRSEIMTFVE